MSVTDKELEDLEKQIEQKVEEAPKEPPKEPEVTPEPQPDKEPSKEEPETPDDSPSPDNQFNASEWVKKKGWKSAEDAAKSLHDLEKSFHEKSEEVKKLKEQRPAEQPPMAPGYAPGYYPTQSAPPSYAPPPNPYAPAPYQGYQQPRMSEEQVAASYNMTVEDFKRVLAVSRDMAEIQNRQIAVEFQKWKDDVNKQNDKNTDMTSVLSDPAFHNPDVQFEMHELLSKNPNLWTDRKPYSMALKEALSNIGRRNMTGNNGNSRSQNGHFLPTDPPKMAGSNNSGTGLPGKRLGQVPTIKELESKSPDEIEKILKGLNAVKTYQDYA